jgi:type IV secretion system protein VirB9
MATLMATAIALLLCGGVAHARYRPQPCGNDPHIQCAIYDPNEVYEVPTVKGAALFIELEPGEKLLNNGTGAGLAAGWTVVSNDEGFLIKQAQPKPDSNFLVVTNRRHYAFALVNSGDAKSAAWILSFDYPDTRARQEASAEQKTDAIRAAMRNLPPNLAEPHNNMDYMMRGDKDLAPSSLWDDGRFTYFQYGDARALPAGVYSILPDGSERTANFHMEGGTMVVETVQKQFIVRSGLAVLGIRNDGYDAKSQYNESGTTIPGTVRILKEPDSSRDQAGAN